MPDLVVREIDMFLPPKSSKPIERIAPILAITSTWVFPKIY
jgi:hypothetical protein